MTPPDESYAQISTSPNPDLIWFAWDDEVVVLGFTSCVLPASAGAALELVTRRSNDPVADALAAAREIAGRGPEAVRGAKRLINRISTEDIGEGYGIRVFGKGWKSRTVRLRPPRRGRSPEGFAFADSIFSRG